MKKYRIYQLLSIMGYLLLSPYQIVLANNHEYRDLLFHTTRNQYFKNQHPGFLAPASSGRVKKILSPTTFELSTGIKIKMLGIDNPLSHGDEKSHECFAQQMKRYLGYHLKGRKVILRQDRTDFDTARHLLRYVYLPGWDKHEKEIFFTEKMIKDGYAKPFFEGKNKQHKDDFNKLVQTIYKDPRGSWQYCFKRLLQKDS